MNGSYLKLKGNIGVYVLLNVSLEPVHERLADLARPCNDESKGTVSPNWLSGRIN